MEFPTALPVALPSFVVCTDSRARETSSRDQVASQADVGRQKTGTPSKCVDAS